MMLIVFESAGNAPTFAVRDLAAELPTKNVRLEARRELSTLTVS